MSNTPHNCNRANNVQPYNFYYRFPESLSACSCERLPAPERTWVHMKDQVKERNVQVHSHLPLQRNVQVKVQVIEHVKVNRTIHVQENDQVNVHLYFHANKHMNIPLTEHVTVHMKTELPTVWPAKICNSLPITVRSHEHH